MQEVTIHGKLTAIGYLIEHNVYGNEWQGAGMYHAITAVYGATTTTFKKSYLDKLLIDAEDF